MLFKYISRNAFRGYRQLVRGLTYENRLHGHIWGVICILMSNVAC